MNSIKSTSEDSPTFIIDEAGTNCQIVSKEIYRGLDQRSKRLYE